MFGSTDSNLKELFQEFSGVLPKENLIDIEAYIDAREWEMAFEELCHKLFENKVLIDLNQYDKIEKIGRQMKMQAKNWEILKPLIKN